MWIQVYDFTRPLQDPNFHAAKRLQEIIGDDYSKFVAEYNAEITLKLFEKTYNEQDPP
jgi:hypothetical protein